ncbi:MAG: hypothetical protein ABIJ43_05735 [Candidatus Beckwithbacteria bacterium]|nr:hypothetical protein [Patescibacteria group bacterium]
MKKRRKNYLPSLILVIVLWCFLAGMIFYIEPELIKDVLVKGFYLPFFILFIPTIFLTLALILGNTKQGLLIAVGLGVFLILRIFELGNALNFLLIIGIVIAIDRS